MIKKILPIPCLVFIGIASKKGLLLTQLKMILNNLLIINLICCFFHQCATYSMQHMRHILPFRVET